MPRRLRKLRPRSRATTGRRATSSAATLQIVFTPGSGIGGARRRARALARVFRRRRLEPTLHAFANLAALRRWADTCEPHFTHLVCVGGDATMSAAAVAAVRTGAAFVPVPAGFGNIFAQSFHYPDRVKAVARILESGQVRRVDIGLAHGGEGAEAFLSHRSYGILEQIQHAAERGRRQPRRRLLRYFWYYGVAYRLLFRTRLASFTVELDGEPVTDDAVLVTVANVETYRGFLSLTPAASPIDGRFDVAIIGRKSKLALIACLLKLLFKLPGDHGVTVRRGRHVVVTTPRRREELTVWRRALPLLVPPGAMAALERRTVDGER